MPLYVVEVSDEICVYAKSEQEAQEIVFQCLEMESEFLAYEFLEGYLSNVPKEWLTQRAYRRSLCDECDIVFSTVDCKTLAIKD